MGEIKQPKDKKIYNGKLGVSVKYNPAFADTWNERMQRVQSVIDSESLKLMAPYTPMRTGELMHSATLGTVIGSGKIVYTHPGARYLYYGEIYGPNIPIKENGVLVGFFSRDFRAVAIEIRPIVKHCRAFGERVDTVECLAERGRNMFGMFTSNAIADFAELVGRLVKYSRRNLQVEIFGDGK